MTPERKRMLVGLAAIALIALAVTALPSGRTVTRIVDDGLQAVFLALVALAAGRYFRSDRYWPAELDDTDRTIVYGAAAVALFALAAKGHFTAIGNGGSLLRWAIIGACVAAIAWVWGKTRRYTV